VQEFLEVHGEQRASFARPAIFAWRGRNLADNKQERKYMLSLAGEFLVAGELLRRNLNAAVTYGNAKKADVVAVSGRSACTIEVKTTQQQKWVVGGKVPEPDGSIWVLVYLPDDPQPAEFFILTGFELHVILKPIKDAEKYGHSMPGVYSVLRRQIEKHKDAWQKIITALETSAETSLPQSK
jgi:hypothetical protein